MLLTQFRHKVGYPIYLTIGNIPKSTRRKPSHHAQLLIGYIPTTKLEGMTNHAARRRAQANLYHSCMRTVLALITVYGESGIPMKGGDVSRTLLSFSSFCLPVFVAQPVM